MGDGAGEQRLSGARRTVEQDASLHLQACLGEDLGLDERKYESFSECGHSTAKSCYIVEAGRWYVRYDPANRRWGDESHRLLPILGRDLELRLRLRSPGLEYLYWKGAPQGQTPSLVTKRSQVGSDKASCSARQIGHQLTATWLVGLERHRASVDYQYRLAIALAGRGHRDLAPDAPEPPDRGVNLIAATRGSDDDWPTWLVPDALDEAQQRRRRTWCGPVRRQEVDF